MADRVLIPLPGVGTLELPREIYEAHLRPIGALAQSGNVLPSSDALPESLLDAGELAKALKLPKSCVYEKARTGEFPSVRVGKHVRFRRSAVLEALSTAPQASGHS